MRTGQYRDGVFSAASPAPRYGTLITSFEDGSLGGLEEDAAALLNPVLSDFIVPMAVSVSPVGKGGVGGARGISGSAAVNIAKAASESTDINEKLSLCLAALYAGTHFGIPAGPQDPLMRAVGQVCDMFAMTANQRAALHQQAMVFYRSFIQQQEYLQRRSEALLEKGNAMSGVFRDGVLGSSSVYRDGVLGTLMRQPLAVRDGSLGYTPIGRRFSSTATTAPLPFKPLLNKFGFPITPDPRRKKQRRPLKPVSGLGCGCAGLGEEAAAAAPFYKNPLVLGGAAVALGVVIYAVSKR